MFSLVVKQAKGERVTRVLTYEDEEKQEALGKGGHKREVTWLTRAKIKLANC